MQAQGHERVLQRCPRARVGVHVAAGHAAQAKPPGKLRQAAVACPVALQVGALQLDAQALAAKALAQAPQRDFIVDPVRVAAAQADQALGVGEHLVEAHARLAELTRALARGGMRSRQQPAEVRPAARVAHQKRQVATVGEVELGAVQRPQAQRGCALGELHRARHGVVVGQRKGLIAKLQRGHDELLGQRGAVQKRVGRVCVQFHVHANTCSHRATRLTSLHSGAA